jgi:hypothetical protein
MALSDEELTKLAEQLHAMGYKAPEAPAVAPEHPAAVEVTPVESLLDQLRLQPTPATVAVVGGWLVEHGYEEAPLVPEPDAEPIAPGTEEYVRYQAWLKSQEEKPEPDAEPIVDPQQKAYEEWLADNPAPVGVTTTTAPPTA